MEATIETVPAETPATETGRARSALPGETYQEWSARVVVATERLKRGEATPADMAMIREIIDGHASFIAMVEKHAAGQRKATRRGRRWVR